MAGGAPTVRLVGRYQLGGSADPVTVVRLRFDPSTVEQGNFDDRDYLRRSTWPTPPSSIRLPGVGAPARRLTAGHRGPAARSA